MLVIPTPESIYRGNYASLPAATLKPPVEGNRTVPIEVNWLNNGQAPQYTIHFNARQQQTLPISQIAALHIDNSNASSSMHVAFPDTQFEVIVGPNTVGFYPVVTNSLEFWCWIDKTPLVQDKTIIQVLNFLPPPIFFSTQPGGTGVGTVREVDTVAPLQGGPITDIGTVSLATPLALNFGGTGSTTAGGALDNLSGASGAVAGTLVRAAGTPGVWSVAAGLSSPISVANGGTGLTTLSPGNRSLVSNGTGNVIVSSIMSDNGSTITVSTNEVIGTATPGAPSPGLTINQAVSAPLIGAPAGTGLWMIGDGANEAEALLDGYGASGVPAVIGRRARGTAAAPTATQNGDALLALNAIGYGTGFAGNISAQILAVAQENFTATAQGGAINFATTTIGTTAFLGRMSLRQGLAIASNVATPDPGPGALTLNQNTVAPLHPAGSSLYIIGADNAGPGIAVDSYGTSGSNIYQRHARGTAAAPTATQANDIMATFGVLGYGATNWGSYKDYISYTAHQTWTDTAQGTLLVFATTPDGTTTPVSSLSLQGTTATFSGAVNIPANANLSLSSGTISNDGSTWSFHTSAGNNGYIFFNNAAAQLFTIDNAGNLNAAGSNHSFGVYGTTNACAFNVNAGSAADSSLLLHATKQWKLNAQGFTSAGDFWIYDATASALRVQLATGGANNVSAAWGIVSDAALKSDVAPLPHGLAEVLQLNPCSFTYKDSGLPGTGLIAQEVEAIMPDLVRDMPTDEAGGSAKAVVETGIIWPLVNAIKELKAELDALKAQLGA